MRPEFFITKRQSFLLQNGMKIDNSLHKKFLVKIQLNQLNLNLKKKGCKKEKKNSKSIQLK